MNKDLKKLVRDRFSSFSEIEEYRKRVESGLLPWEERISELFLSIPGRLLDIGCGGGREAIALSTRRHEIIGIDISKAQVESAGIAARRFGKKIEFRLCNGIDLDFECGYFNYIVMWGQAFGNVPKQENRLHLVKECSRVLKHSGRLIISVHDRDVCEPILKSSNTIKALPSPELEPGDFILQGDSESNTQCYWHYFTKEELIDLSNQAGFKTVECKLASGYGQEGWDTILVMVSEK